MDSSRLDSSKWRRSSKCDGGACVEVAQLGVVIMIRDSAEPRNAPLAVSKEVWRDFASAVRAGVFDVR